MSIRSQLLIAFVICGVAPVAAVASLAFFNSRSSLIELTGDLLAERATTTQTRLELMLDRWHSETLTWAAAEATLRTFETDDPKFLEDYAHDRMLLRREFLFMLALSLDDEILGAAALREDGTRADTTALTGLDLTAAEWMPTNWNAVDEVDTPHFTGAQVPPLVALYPDVDRWVLVPAEVWDEFDDQVGYLLSAVPLDRIRTAVWNQEHLESSDRKFGHTAVFDRQDRFLFSSFATQNDTAVDLSDLAPDLAPEARVRDGYGLSGAHALVLRPEDAAYPALSASGWQVLVIADEEHALRSVTLLGWGVLSLSVIALLIAGMLAKAVAKRQIESIGKLSEMATSVLMSGDAAEHSGDGELGALGAGLRALAGRQRAILMRLKDGVEELGERVEKAGDSVSDGSAIIRARLHDTSAAVTEMFSSLRDIESDVDALFDNTDQSATATLELNAAAHDVSGRVEETFAAVAATASSIEEMSSSIRETATNVEQFNAFVGSTVISMREIDGSTQQIQADARETAEISESVAQEGEQGVSALRETMCGLDVIKESSVGVALFNDRLNSHISEIDSVLSMITDVVNQTHLLSLNASIIAAQAGEHGRGFKVVADAVKELASKTRSSTVEIATLIEKIQEESINTREAIESGVQAVDDGIRIGAKAQDALQRILTSARRATDRVRSIADATGVQGKTTRDLADATHRIERTVTDLTRATQEQARVSEQLVLNTNKIQDLARAVAVSSRGQADGSKNVGDALEKVRAMVDNLRAAQIAQTQRCERVLLSVGAIEEVSDAQTDTVAQLDTAIGSLKSLNIEAETMIADLQAVSD